MTPSGLTMFIFVCGSSYILAVYVLWETPKLPGRWPLGLTLLIRALVPAAYLLWLPHLIIMRLWEPTNRKEMP